jgi:protein-tyrosine-phosphatase
MGIGCISCGLDAVGGAPASALAIETAAGKGIDLRSHRSRAFSQVELLEDDLIVGMEPEHARRIHKLVSGQQKISLLGLWAAPPQPHICDPYGLCPEYYSYCFRLIDTAIERLHTSIRLK